MLQKNNLLLAALLLLTNAAIVQAPTAESGTTDPEPQPIQTEATPLEQLQKRAAATNLTIPLQVILEEARTLQFANQGDTNIGTFIQTLEMRLGSGFRLAIYTQKAGNAVVDCSHACGETARTYPVTSGTVTVLAVLGLAYACSKTVKNKVNSVLRSAWSKVPQIRNRKAKEIVQSISN